MRCFIIFILFLFYLPICFSQEKHKVIKEIRYVNGETVADVDAQIKKLPLNGDWEEKGKKFRKSFPDSTDCSRFEKISIIPFPSSIYEIMEIECGDIKNLVVVKSLRDFISTNNVDWASNFSGSEVNEVVYGFEKDDEIDKAISMILRPIGMEKIFENNRINIQSAAIPNAQAAFVDNQRYIFYNPDILDKILKEEDWATIGIFSHEIAHFLSLHKIVSNSNSQLKEVRHKLELEADEWAGFILAYLNADEVEVLKMLDLVNYEGELLTHPSIDKREKAIITGYERAKEVRKNALINSKYKIYASSAKEAILNKQFNIALKYLDTAITFNQFNSYLFSDRAYARLYRKGYLFDKNLFFSDADKAVRLDPENLHALELRAQSFFYNNTPAEAENDVALLNKESRETPMSLYLNGQLSLWKGRNKEALEFYDKAILADNDFSTVYESRASLLFMMGSRKEALKDYNYLTKRHPESGQFRSYLGGFYYQQQNYTEAIKQFTKAIELEPTQAFHYYWRGTCFNTINNQLYTNKNFEEVDTNRWKALADFQKAVELNSSNLDFIAALGNAYYALSDYDEAIEIYLKLVELNPTDFNFNYLGNSHYQKRDYNNAIDSYNQSLSLNKKNYLSRIGIAFSMAFLENYDESIKAFEDLNEGLVVRVDVFGKAYALFFKERLQRSDNAIGRT